ncbi:MAG: AMP-dependent synthetase/ligase [Microcoleaceae cyanobacterium]
MNYSSNSLSSRYQSLRSLPDIWPILAEAIGEQLALHDPHSRPEIKITFGEFWSQVQTFAAGLQTLGIEPEGGALPSRVALFADDSPRWLVADQGIMLAGAADAVRGAMADPAELIYILNNSGSIGLVVETLKLLKTLQGNLVDLPLKFVVLLSDEEPTDIDLPFPVFNFAQLLTKGENSPLNSSSRDSSSSGLESNDLNRLATLLYTSGTTGQPKGVMLTHGNLLHQVNAIIDVLQPQVGECYLSILPTWHSFGRIGQYFSLSQGCVQVYTSIRHFKQDLKQFKPHYMTSVPRIWESIYEGAQKQLREQPSNRQKLVRFFFTTSERYVLARRIAQGLTLDSPPPSATQQAIARLQALLLSPVHALGDRLIYQNVREAVGGQLKSAISGGGSLATHLENFYETVGIELLVGYGLTETAPVLTARRSHSNLRGSAGRPIPQTELRIVDPETRQPLPIGEKGLVLARGPQVMEGYFANPEATAKAINPEGWFDTGDLGCLTPQNDLILTGRAKDTIVLTNGENIEPQPIEDACMRSLYIDQIVLVGQDQKMLGALIVPNLETLKQWAIEQNLSIQWPDPSELQTSELQTDATGLDSPAVQELFRQELTREVKNRPSYRPDDRIGCFKLVLEPFSMDNGLLTQTLKIKRPVVTERYRDMINEMYR